MGKLTAIITRDSEILAKRYDVDTVYRELRRAQLSKQEFARLSVTAGPTRNPSAGTLLHSPNVGDRMKKEDFFEIDSQQRGIIKSNKRLERMHIRSGKNSNLLILTVYAYAP